MNASDPVSATLQSWADRELTDWRNRDLRRAETERLLHQAAAPRADVRLYRFADGRVAMQKLLTSVTPVPSKEVRAQAYLRFFTALLPLLPPGLNTTICMCLEDRVTLPLDVPCFGFQRAQHETSALMPDIDVICLDFYEHAQFADAIPYADKAIRAVFTGSTTGGHTNLERARQFVLPRLRAAHFFEHHDEVDFRLPSLAQCSDDARAFLQTQSFCQMPRIDWREQFRTRFLLSMDGNGATCSRVAIALASQAVLLKYDSPHILYYFPALVPHEHYIPIAQDQEVLEIVQAERAQPGKYAHVPVAANAFTRTYLTRPRVMEYAARLIASYAALLNEGEAERTEGAPRRINVTARGGAGTEYEKGPDGWTGLRGSGEKLTALRLITRPPAGAPRLLYQGFLEDGRFTPTAREGGWCRDAASDAGLAGLEILPARGAPKLPVSIEARCTDGTMAEISGTTCRSVTGAPFEAIRVRLP